MENLALKVKISVLWLFYTVSFLVVMTLVSMEPGAIEQIMALEIYGLQMGSELLLAGAIEFLVPLVMAFLSLTLKDSINRWANIILGIVFTALSLITLIEALASLPAHAILMDISIFVATALIVWHA